MLAFAVAPISRHTTSYASPTRPLSAASFAKHAAYGTQHNTLSRATPKPGHSDRTNDTGDRFRSGTEVLYGKTIPGS